MVFPDKEQNIIQTYIARVHCINAKLSELARFLKKKFTFDF